MINVNAIGIINFIMPFCLLDIMKFVTKQIIVKTRTKKTVAGVIKSLNNLIKELDKKDHGLILIVDEMGKFLDYASSVGSDLNLFQEIAEKFKDIPLKEFKKASRLIEPNGSVYNGPDSAYRSYHYTSNPFPWHRWYKRYTWFTWLSDHGYNHIAKNRPFFFRLTHILFGKNPKKLKPYWLLYLTVIVVVIILFIKQI